MNLQSSTMLFSFIAPPALKPATVNRNVTKDVRQRSTSQIHIALKSIRSFMAFLQLNYFVQIMTGFFNVLHPALTIDALGVDPCEVRNR
jgi:hypothetical protein